LRIQAGLLLALEWVSTQADVIGVSYSSFSASPIVTAQGEETSPKPVSVAISPAQPATEGSEGLMAHAKGAGASSLPFLLKPTSRAGSPLLMGVTVYERD